MVDKKAPVLDPETDADTDAQMNDVISPVISRDNEIKDTESHNNVHPNLSPTSNNVY